MRSMGPLDEFNAVDDEGLPERPGKVAAPKAWLAGEVRQEVGDPWKAILGRSDGKWRHFLVATGRKPYPRGKSQLHGPAPRQLVGRV
ncbi:hypothetical protein D3C84_739030 [compost metagenome]